MQWVRPVVSHLEQDKKQGLSQSNISHRSLYIHHALLIRMSCTIAASCHICLCWLAGKLKKKWTRNITWIAIKLSTDNLVGFLASTTLAELNIVQQIFIIIVEGPSFRLNHRVQYEDLPGKDELCGWSYWTGLFHSCCIQHEREERMPEGSLLLLQIVFSIGSFHFIQTGKTKCVINRWVFPFHISEFQGSEVRPNFSFCSCTKLIKVSKPTDLIDKTCSPLSLCLTSKGFCSRLDRRSCSDSCLDTSPWYHLRRYSETNLQHKVLTINKRQTL